MKYEVKESNVSSHVDKKTNMVSVHLSLAFTLRKKWKLRLSLPSSSLASKKSSGCLGIQGSILGSEGNSKKDVPTEEQLPRDFMEVCYCQFRTPAPGNEAWVAASKAKRCYRCRCSCSLSFPFPHISHAKKRVKFATCFAGELWLKAAAAKEQKRWKVCSQKFGKQQHTCKIEKKNLESNLATVDSFCIRSHLTLPKQNQPYWS